MPLIIESGLFECGGCGALCDYVEALPKDADGHLSGGGPVAATHEFIHANCPHPNHPDGTWHEPHDHAAVLEHVRASERRLDSGEYDFPPDPVRQPAPDEAGTAPED